MKLHLPCALRGALLACFALACTTPTWAADIIVDGVETAYYIKKGSTDTSYTLKPSSDAVAQGVSINALNISESVSIYVGNKDSAFTAIEIENVLVADKKNLTIYVADNTTLYLNNVNFTGGTVNYVLGENANLVISADDCGKGSISGTGNVYWIKGSTINATSVNDTNWFRSDSYPGSAAQVEIDNWSVYYEASGSNITFDLAPGATDIHINGPGGTGGTVNHADDGFYPLAWAGSGGAHRVTPDEPSVIIDPDGVYRDGDAGSKFWFLQVDESVENLQSGEMGDITEHKLVTLANSDALRFAGGTLTSSKNVTLGCSIEGDGTNAIKLKPAKGTSITFTNGDGALGYAQGLELWGGSGSTVNILGISAANAEITNVHFMTDNTTLGLGGQDTITVDATQNTIRATSSISKLDGGTLVYNPKDTDEIGTVSNTTGTVKIGGTSSLTAETLTAGTLDISVDGTGVDARTVNVGDLNLSSVNAVNTLTTKTLTSSGTITIDGFAQLTASSMKANNVDVSTGSLLTGDTLKATGTVTVGSAMNGYTSPQGIVVGNATLNGKDGGTATLTGMDFSTSLLAASSMDGAMLVVTEPVTRAASTPVLKLGTVTNSTIDIVAGTTIQNTSFGSGSVVNAAGDLTLNGTTHAADSTLTVADASSVVSFKGTGAEFANGASFTIDGSSYSSTTNDKVASVTITSGNATKDTLTINSAVVNMPGVEADDVDGGIDIFLGDGNNTVTGMGTVKVYAAPGVAGDATFEGGKMVVTLTDQSEQIVAALKHNSNTANYVNALVANAVRGGDDSISEIYNYLRDFMRADEDSRQAVLDALASGSITMLTDAQRRGVTNTIHALRNRVIQMGNPQGIEPQTKIHGWIEADGASNQVDGDEMGAGYDYVSWGGTVGVHADVANYSFGAAISASYGDLTASTQDQAEGELNTVALSAFARHQSGGWTQMGILSFARNEMEMTRHITAARKIGDTSHFDSKGDSSGFTATGYYEAGYAFALGEEGTHVLQPLVSVMFTAARMGDYTETGSIGNAGLCTDTEDYFYGTVGVGARYQVVLGTNVENRICFGELRAKLVRDFGDETNEVPVWFQGAPSHTFSLRGADVGRMAFQFGAGISVPVGVYTTLFADADADIRSGSTSYSGSMGVRVEF